ncbi:MAG: hypothetical protein ABJA98_26925 [Acidobacteriota bacterium]
MSQLSLFHSDVGGNSTSGRSGDIIHLKPFAADGERWHAISVVANNCSCPAFGLTGRCDHLAALGLRPRKSFTPSTYPTFSQALSGLVKSLRIRKLDEAVYWLCYLDRFRETRYRFRTARRLLIGSAEDGHSVAVMERVGERFATINKPRADLAALVAEAIRICKVPNWWHPDSGGPDYIYQSMVGQRRWLYRSWDHRVTTLSREIRMAIENREPAMALGGVMAFAQVRETFGATRQAQFLLGIAEQMGHDLAVRLCELHLSAKSALSGDNNFLCQAAWMMAGGTSPVAATIFPVTAAECGDLIDQAEERWKNPRPIPRWCLDGVHSAGDDPRFMGCLPEMWAVCKAFQHYGRVDPSDEWLPEFRCYDGLIIDGPGSAEARV